MKGKYMLFIVLTIALALPLIFIIKNKRDSANEHLHLTGTLVFGMENCLYSFNLENKKIVNLYERRAMIYQLSKIDNDNFLFVENSSIAPIIKKFNLATNTAETIRRGSAPQYMPRHKKILFLYTPSFEDEQGLYVADIDNPIESARRIITTGELDENIIAVSDSKIVFLKDSAEERGDEHTVWSYDLESDKIEALSIKDCSLPKFWIASREQLVCSSATTGKLFLTDLAGMNVQQLPDGINTQTFLSMYIPESDAFIFMISTIKDSTTLYNLWAYEYATGHKELICEGKAFSINDGIYYPNMR